MSGPAAIMTTIRLPKELHDRVRKHRDQMRTEHPMANMSDAIRALLEQALNGKRR